jgi:hypothetical protein
MKVTEVEVDVRLWATEPANHLVRIPVAERGVLVADHPESEDKAPMLLIGDQPVLVSNAMEVLRTRRGLDTEDLARDLRIESEDLDELASAPLEMKLTVPL